MAKQSKANQERRVLLEQMRAEQQRQEARTRRLWIAGGVALALFFAAAVGYALSNRSSSAPVIKGVQTFGKQSQNHVDTSVHYAQTPPVGGEHSPTPLTCGIYTSPVPNENAVHSMEHGAVWITYQATLPAADVASLQAAVRGKTYVILSPYQNLGSSVVASAWGVQLKLTSPKDPRLAQFVSAYAAGPQTPEPGAPCRGTGSPAQ